MRAGVARERMAAPFQVNLHCRDVGAMFDYFTGVLGFEPEFRVAGPGGRAVFAGVGWGKGARGGRVILGDIHEALHGHYDHGDFGKQMEAHPLGTGVVLYFQTRNVDKLHARIAAKGAVVDEPPTDQFWGDRTISVLTPDGYYVTFAQPIRGFRFPDAFATRTQTWGRVRGIPARRPKPSRAGARRTV
jgi:uncharacterized glyoxalase superfamily protein PhnB